MAKKITEIQRFTHNLDRLLGFKFRGLFHMNIDGDVYMEVAYTVNGNTPE